MEAHVDRSAVAVRYLQVRIMNDKPNYGYGVGALLGVLVSIALGALYLHFKPVTAPVGVHIEAPASPVVRGVGKEAVQSVPLRAYKPAAKKKLDLPATIQADQDKHVVSSVKTPNDERKHTITTIVDSQTGEFTTYDRVEPLPWIGVTTKSEVGAYLGLKNGQPAIRVEGRQEVLQIKSVRIGAIGSVDVTQSGVDKFVGIGAWVRW